MPKERYQQPSNEVMKNVEILTPEQKEESSKFEAYFKNLLDHNDKDLENIYRIRDNWIIYIGEDVELKSFTDCIEKNNKFFLAPIYHETKNEYGWAFLEYYYSLGTVSIAIPTKEDMIRNKSNFPEEGVGFSIQVHPYQDKKMENASRTRALAEVINIIGEYIIKNDVPADFIYGSHKNKKESEIIQLHRYSKKYKNFEKIQF